MPRSGRPKVTTRAEDRYIATTVARNRFVTGPQTPRQLYAVRGPGARPVSVQTVRNRIHASGFKSRVPAKKPKLTQRHKDARLTFSRAHAGWNNPQWRRVMFSDESKFYLNRVDGRKRVWRRCRERHVPAMVIPTVAFQGGGVTVWAGISATAKTDLVFIDGNLNGQRYINEVLTHHVLPFLCQMPVPDPIFQDDNARLHQARIVNDFIHRNNVNRMAWPAVLPALGNSRDLSSKISIKPKGKTPALRGHSPHPPLCKHHPPYPGVLMKTFFILNSTEHEILTAHKYRNSPNTLKFYY